MSSVPSRGYEFNEEQNVLLGDLAKRMRGVGFFLFIVGLLNLLAAALVVVAIYRAKLPQSYVDAVVAKASEASRTDVGAQLANLPPDHHLWAVAFGSAINGLIYVLIGSWTGNASGSFKKIVDTKGSDIGHLMEGLTSLNKMYQLIYALIAFGLLAFLATIGLFIYVQMSR